jgi:hypothetical protein
MTKGTKLQIVVRSEKVARLIEFEAPLMTVYGKVGVTKKWARVYDYVLDERQTHAIDRARELASDSGLILEVIDLSQVSLLRRLLRRPSGRTFSVGPPRLAPPVASTPVRLEEELAVG